VYQSRKRKNLNKHVGDGGKERNEEEGIRRE